MSHSDTHEHGGCGCGGEHGTGAGLVEAPVLSTDARLDVRSLPHEGRHATVLATIAALPAGAAVVLIAPHAPRPLLAEVDARFGGQVEVRYLQSGPEVWQVRVQRVATAAG